MKKNFLLLFFLFAIANIACQSLDLEIGVKISKALLMPSLGFYFYAGWRSEKATAFYLTLAALLFAWVGDVFF